MKKFILFFSAAFCFHFANAQALSVSISVTSQVLCYGGNSGSATATPSGGTSPYTYAWNPSGGNTPTATGLVAGAYTVTVTDAVFATANATVVITQPSQLVANTVSSFATCGNNNGTTTATYTGGTPPITYSWTPSNYNGPMNTSLTAGSYTCTIVDSHGCVATASTIVTQTGNPTINISSTNNCLCFGDNTGSAACAVAGNGPFNYMWNPNVSSSQTANNLSAGNYTVTVTDQYGCTASASCVITQPPVLTATISSTTNCLCFGNNDGNAYSTVSGGTPSYSYNWNNVLVSQNATNVPAGNWNLTVTDANGCIATTSCTITQPPQLVIVAGPIIPSGCSQCDGSIYTTVNGGVTPYTYLWNNSNINNLQMGLCSGGYTCVVTDANGCTDTTSATLTDSCNYVWPGDANEDAVADNNDILAIGIANSATGTARANATTNWIGQPSTNWGQTLSNGTDYKFVDCDGNGVIDPNDTNAVIQNFGYTHNMRTGAPPAYDATLPDLKITMNQSNLAANSQGTLTVSFGTNSIPVSNFYGLAFTLNFDATQIDAASFHMNENGTWMGIPGTDLMGVVLNSGTGTGSVQVAITRLNHANANGFGNIANMTFMTTNALTGTGQTQNVNFTISNVTVISANEVPQNVNVVNDSVVVEDPLLLGMNENNYNSFSVYPNPFNQSTTIVLPQNIAANGSEIVITDLQGRIVRDEKIVGTNSYMLQRGDLETGMYFCTVKSEGKVVGVTKIMVQ